jgi:hypothetical protein
MVFPGTSREEPRDTKWEIPCDWARLVDTDRVSFRLTLFSSGTKRVEGSLSGSTTFSGFRSTGYL